VPPYLEHDVQDPDVDPGDHVGGGAVTAVLTILRREGGHAFDQRLSGGGGAGCSEQSSGRGTGFLSTILPGKREPTKSGAGKTSLGDPPVVTPCKIPPSGPGAWEVAAGWFSTSCRQGLSQRTPGGWPPACGGQKGCWVALAPIDLTDKIS